MGYISTVEGQLSITDTRNRRVFSKSFVDESKSNNIEIPDYRFDGETVFADLQSKFDRWNELHWVISVSDTDLGYTVVYSEAGKAYTIDEDVQKIVDYFKNDGYAVEGEIRIIGEESPDFSRVIVRDGVAVLEQATVTISFPDGSTWD